jgi:hypothetical protein
MKKLTTLLLIFTTLLIYAEQKKVVYAYDQAGNRVSRVTITLGSSPVKGYKPDSTVVEEQINSMEIKIYPNPTRGILKIELPDNGKDEIMRIQIFDGKGNSLINKEALTGFNEVDLSVQPKGWYVLRIVSGEVFREFKIVKK